MFVTLVIVVFYTKIILGSFENLAPEVYFLVVASENQHRGWDVVAMEI